jgi:hypothetical protein
MSNQKSKWLTARVHEKMEANVAMCTAVVRIGAARKKKKKWGGVL